MSREIKFRAWHEQSKEMVYRVERGCYLENSFREILEAEYPLMQFTGLKDKNGKDIYEGDLLGGIFGSLSVKWCDNCRGWALYCKSDKECYGCIGEVHWQELSINDLEVIGNVLEAKP